MIAPEDNEKEDEEIILGIHVSMIIQRLGILFGQVKCISHRNQLLLHVWLESNGESSLIIPSLGHTKQTGDPNDCLETALVPSQPSPKNTVQPS